MTSLAGAARFVCGLLAAVATLGSAADTPPPNRPPAPLQSQPAVVAGIPVPSSTAAGARPSSAALPWLLNSPAPFVISESRANPVAVPDKFASRVKSIELRGTLRAYEGAPPVVPHPTGAMNLQTCRACHATGLRAGDKTARMVAHTYLQNCTQCHVEAPATEPDGSPPQNSFVGRRATGYGGTRAWAGAPPVLPHTVFMRNNCVSCHGEYGYDGWRPDHLSRTNCMQCHAPSAEFEQLSPTFGVPDAPDGSAIVPDGRLREN